jgi:hypothetical protein
MTTIGLHRVLGLSLFVFITAHIGNHVSLFWGVDQHLAIQGTLRKIYRNPIVETVLLAGFGTQLFLGARLLLKRGWPQRFWPRMQWLSGVTLALFLGQHISAALYTRAFWPSIDTNIYWAASVVSQTHFALYFVPYYILGVGALFVHIATFLALKKRLRGLAWSICILGSLFAVILIATLSGAFYSIDLPLPYVLYLNGSDL